MNTQKSVFSYDGTNLTFDSYEIAFDGVFLSSVPLDVALLPEYITDSRGELLFDLDLFLSQNIEVGVVVLVGLTPTITTPLKSVNGAFYRNDDAINLCFGLSQTVTPPVDCNSVSLNGNYYSFKDGDIVVCYPSSIEFTVVRSYLVGYDKNSLTIVYDLLGAYGKNHRAPHEFLALKV